MLKLQAHPAGTILFVKIVPNSSRDAIVGLLGEALKIKVAKPPEAGAANKAVCALLAKTLQVAPGQVTVHAGHSQPQKQVLLTGISLERASAALAPFIK